MRKKILTLLLIMAVLLTCISSVAVWGTDIENPQTSEASSQQLQLFKSDLQLTQEQTMSRIKAEYLIKNNGYLDSDDIGAIIMLSDDSLVDEYIDDYSTSAKSVAEYADTSEGRSYISSIEAKQQTLIRELIKKGYIEDESAVLYTYSTVINAVAVKTTYGMFNDLSKLASVEQVLISDTYNLPQNATDVSAIENPVEVYETGIFDSSSVDYRGKGTSVAVLDSGFDCSHSVFEDKLDEDTLMLTKDGIDAVLGKTNAAGSTSGLDIDKVWRSNKIPFVYDYADKDSDVDPYDSEHGTHVAGIIGGKDDVITGIAVETQLVLLKVFPDLNTGAETDDILAALEDAVLLGVDAINMSLGSSCGFAREADGNAINAVYDSISASGISLVTAASNSYSSSFGGAQGNTNKVTNPDSGTVGSPSTYAAAISVASINGIKSKYLVGNDSQVIFFTESNSISGDENDFFKELGLKQNETKTYEYITVPGVGLKVNYASVDVRGKIALIRRGDSTFEDKALQAKNAGAVACIIYNNIEGNIQMSMGKTDHIPTISISKEAGTILASRNSGTIALSYDYQAGPFMSDFSSWGPTGNLEIKPEITAHGGNITSAVPNGGYDQLSGTSMASPNLCGIVVLIRQYLKENYPDYTSKQIAVMTNQMLMSTAAIIKNEQGNPYSPRKQGAGLASLYNVVNTGAYITVDNSDKTKLELKDDPERTGVYKMDFNVVNISDSPIEFDLSVVGMTESVSASDSDYVAEMSYILNGSTSATLIEGGALSGGVLTVDANETAKLSVTYTLSDEDKNYIENSFLYGMYVEGFVKLSAKAEDDISLSVPFLAFYGDWTQAPLFDKTYFEVESQAHDASIDDEDKLKADYYATTPYGSYYYNYIIPLGTYLYDVDKNLYDEIPASDKKIAISNVLGAIDGMSAVYAGLLRNAKTMTYTITDKTTGEVMYSFVDNNATKAHSETGTPLPYYNYLKLKSTALKLVNNHQYEFKMLAKLDYGDGGIETNARNTFAFDFYLDDEAPVIKNVEYEKVYDKSLKKDRFYITMTLYDNQYVQSVSPISFTSTSSYTLLTDNPIPVYSEQGKDSVVRFEITEYLDDLYSNSILGSSLAFAVDDYALNSNIYFCQLPGVKGDFKFTKDGNMDGIPLNILTVNEGEIVDLTDYLATADKSVDAEKDYLKYLDWSSSNENIAIVDEGLVRGLKAGRTTITVSEPMYLKQAVLIINVKAAANAAAQADASPAAESIDYDDAVIKDIRFSYFDTLFAYSRSAQTSKIGSTGDKVYLSSLPSVSFYPGEKIQLHYDLDPWYVKDKYDLSFTSTNEKVAIVDQDGVVTGLKKGTTTIVLSVAGSNLKASLRITIESEFIIENRILVAYKGLGGEVIIPDDEGIVYIGSFAFCLYETDRSVELDEDDYDANKIPSMNTSITSVVIPDGVEDVQKYAFYNCSALKSVTLPDSIKYIREYAFYKDTKLESINLEKIQTIGGYAFKGCEALDNINLQNTFAIGTNAFEGCTSLSTADLSSLRNAGKSIFKGCTSLEEVVLNANTKLSESMFMNSGLTSVDIYEKVEIPQYCFANTKLTDVVIHNDLVKIGNGAFSENSLLKNVTFGGKVENIGQEAFYNCVAIEKLTLPDSEVSIENYAFYKCSSLDEVEFQANTKIKGLQGSVFDDTALTAFVIDDSNPYYKQSQDGALLLNKEGNTIILAAAAKAFGDFVLADAYTVIGAGAFGGANITSLTITNSKTLISDYAFANCASLTTVTFPETAGVVIGKHAFNYTKALAVLNNIDKVKNVGDYAFANSGVKTITLGGDAVFGEGAFFNSDVEEVTIGANSSFGLGAFQKSLKLRKVNMPDGGGVTFGPGAFAWDSSLEEIDLSKVEIIERETFYGCTSLKAAVLTSAVKIGDYAFSDCSSLAFVSVPKVETIGESAFGRNSTDGAAPAIESLVLPETLVSLGDGAFLGCEGLITVTLPSSLEKIGDYVFSYCVRLVKVNMPSSIKSIGKYSFVGCEALSSIDLKDVETIAEFAFYGCEALNDIDLTAVKTIGEGSFAGAYLYNAEITADNLTEIGIYAFKDALIKSFSAKNLKVISEGAFQNNVLLEEFVFSGAIEKVDFGAFYGCTGIKNFYFDNGTDKVDDGVINDYALLDDGVLYTKSALGKLVLSSVPGGKNFDELTVLEGTWIVETYAGNQNANVAKIILPDSLRLIGNYAFYGYKKLTSVEFKSAAAPALESWYDSEAVLAETDPGFELLHNQYDVFGFELGYFNFIDLVGKKNPIKMILPKNEVLTGYDSIIFEAYFGKTADAERSDYTAMETNLVKFIEYAEKIAAIEKITVADEKIVSNAIMAYKSIQQNALDFGYTAEEWNAMVEAVTDANEKIVSIKLANASLKVKNLQAKIKALPTVYTASLEEQFNEITAEINALSLEERAILNLDNYNALKESRANYTNPTDPQNPETPDNNVLMYVLIGVGCFLVVCAAVVVTLVVIKKRKNKNEETK